MLRKVEQKNKKPIKIGLYIQTDELKNRKDFNKAMNKIKSKDFDLLVFPEMSYVPFIDKIKNADILAEEDMNIIYYHCLKLSRRINKAVIVNNEDKYGAIVSFYANAFADNADTETAFYIKHTMTTYSSFDCDGYQDLVKYLFQPILLKGYKIGMTICYDCNHSLFSRAYGVKGIDIIINSTGGDVIYDKWHKYNRARAIENNCYTFVTMGGDGKKENPHTYVYGFNAEGSELSPINILDYDGKMNYPGGVYIYDIAMDNKEQSPDNSLLQKATENKCYHIEIPVGNTNKFIYKSKKLKEDLYLYNSEDESIIFCVIDGEDILRPEMVLRLLYAKELKGYLNRRYIIVNRFEHIDEKFFENKLSTIYKVRSMENFCTVIVESDNINQCYQSEKNRTVQVLKPVDGKFRIDLKRTTGPDTIWKNKQGMRASWRAGYELLLEDILEKSFYDKY